MTTEKQKMLAGELYLASDPELVSERLYARQLIKSFNETSPDATMLRENILKKLVG